MLDCGMHMGFNDDVSHMIIWHNLIMASVKICIKCEYIAN